MPLLTLYFCLIIIILLLLIIIINIINIINNNNIIIIIIIIIIINNWKASNCLNAVAYLIFLFPYVHIDFIFVTVSAVLFTFCNTDKLHKKGGRRAAERKTKEKTIVKMP